MLIYPHINPIAFSLGAIQVHWYGLMYLLGFTMAWGLAHWRVKHYKLDWKAEEISDLIFYAALGVILGGRMGYMLFYDAPQLLREPTSLFKIWQGGMSFHGGVLGVALAMYFLARKLKRPLISVTDFLVPLIPLGLAAGRLGNFINGELWGRITHIPWGMVFPHVDAMPRHPSMLYELVLEGVGLFLLLWWYTSKRRPTGATTAVFLIGYASCRLLVECFREPDRQLGFLAFDWLTMGQLLSLPMLIGGMILYIYAICEARTCKPT